MFLFLVMCMGTITKMNWFIEWIKTWFMFWIPACNNGNHFISLDDEEKSLQGHIVKCQGKNCDSYIRLVKEYDDNYLIQDLGKPV